MCESTKCNREKSNMEKNESSYPLPCTSDSTLPPSPNDVPVKRRSKRTRVIPSSTEGSSTEGSSHADYHIIRKQKSKFQQRHEYDRMSGGIDALIPSLLAVAVGICIVVSRSGFRGRSTVAGVDLGTTNSVICVQEQATKEGVGHIECIPDPFNDSPIIPSCISFQSDSKREKVSASEDIHKSFKLSDIAHPSDVAVGSLAKQRINSHPHTTFYHAKRVIGRKMRDEAVQELQREVEFDICKWVDESNEAEEEDFDVAFQIPPIASSPSLQLKPQNIGSYIVHHLFQITKDHLQHDNVRSAVIAIPVKFNVHQIKATVEAFTDAGIKVARILEEPVAAALAYGLQKKEGVDYIMVYDFGGGTLDVSLLSVSDGGYVEVMGSEGDDELGGADFDSAVVHFLMKDEGNRQAVDGIHQAMDLLSKKDVLLDDVEQVDFEELISVECQDELRAAPLCSISSFHTIAEKMKIDLSALDGKEGTVKDHCLSLPKDYVPSTIPDMCSKLRTFHLELSSEQFDGACSSLFDRSKLPIRNILSELHMTADEIDEVVMVGGTTRMPQIRSIVLKETGLERLNTSIDPDLTVAYGAASVID